VSRRGNGLSADAYTALIDLAPELADTLLTALGEAGIAAYAIAGEVAEPEESLDRLYVDATMEPIAEDILHTHLTRLREQRSGPVTAEPAPEPAPDPAPTTAERDEDAIWADLVASFELAPEDGETPWPDEENIGPEDERRDRDGRLPIARVIKPASPYAAEAPEAQEADDEGHYVPPPPPPLQLGDPVTRGAWIALIGGPVYLLLAVILGWDVPGWAAFAAVAAFIGGFVALVLRMGDEPRDPDDGAVI
jgi:hypothetical protein